MRLQELRETVGDQVVEVQDLVTMLELSIEDILERFGDKLRLHSHKFGVYSDVEEETPE